MAKLLPVFALCWAVAFSAFLLAFMMIMAVKHDCRIPPKSVSLTGAVLMEFACPDTLDKVWR